MCVRTYTVNLISESLCHRTKAFSWAEVTFYLTLFGNPDDSVLHSIVHPSRRQICSCSKTQVTRHKQTLFELRGLCKIYQDWTRVWKKKLRFAAFLYNSSSGLQACILEIYMICESQLLTVLHIPNIAWICIWSASLLKELIQWSLFIRPLWPFKWFLDHSYGEVFNFLVKFIGSHCIFVQNSGDWHSTQHFHNIQWHLLLYDPSKSSNAFISFR